MRREVRARQVLKSMSDLIGAIRQTAVLAYQLGDELKHGASTTAPCSQT
ncbi:hypothetical protein IMCC3135_09365 [Granulosicoccus antarcticus IMCC3135]|uniref:Uncharacterized protein n=1 Tax=Granulosicoccus antarcticus IMCC3135 TaxID=1192854 RepID=A0A2Z2NT96_9GAMM|nr:hypothetical protein IMCC3135_09365 [Granulosicoccus antarcticus IMCC3135]